MYIFFLNLPIIYLQLRAMLSFSFFLKKAITALIYQVYGKKCFSKKKMSTVDHKTINKRHKTIVQTSFASESFWGGGMSGTAALPFRWEHGITPQGVGSCTQFLLGAGALAQVEMQRKRRRKQLPWSQVCSIPTCVPTCARTCTTSFWDT